MNVVEKKKEDKIVEEKEYNAEIIETNEKPTSFENVNEVSNIESTDDSDVTNIKKESKNISSTLELVEVIKTATGANYFYKNHPERKIFQALRIEVNEELTVLESILPKAIKRLKKGGRIAVITFHSLEDRITKQIFKN